MRHYILSLIVLFFATSVTSAETINPNSLLDSSPPNMAKPEAEQSTEENTEENSTVDKDAVEQLWDSTGWIVHQRPLQCHSMQNVRAYTIARGQDIIMSGYKAPGYVASDPFDGMILTRNAITGEYTLLMVQTSTGMTCIVQMGTSLQTTEDVRKSLESKQK
jgi:hypothetical protein